MADKNLDDDMVKLVEYAIVTIDRGKERILYARDGGTPKDGRLALKLVTESMTPESFSTWVVSEANVSNGESAEYLRVYYNVLDRWPKQDLKYEEKQLRILRGIETCICPTPSPPED